MAGGTYKSQNKKQPGVYINVKSDRAPRTFVGDRGIVTICEPLSWGPEGEVMAIEASESYTPYIGYSETTEKARFLQEIFRGSDHTEGPVKVLLYRAVNTGATKALATIGTLTATAIYTGIRGNDITVLVVANPDSPNSHSVQTVIDGTVVDAQSVIGISSLVTNAWVSFSGTGALEANAGTKLSGGSDGTMKETAYSDYLKEMESYMYNIMIYDGKDRVVKEAIASFVKRMRNDIGMKCQAVMANYEANSEAIISVGNGVVLTDGTEIPPEKATWWIGGAEAGAAYNESLVYAQYPNAKFVKPRLSAIEVDAALDTGHIVFMEEFGSVKIVSDINTLTTLLPEKGADFQLNQVVRTLDSIASDIYKQFSLNYIGKLQNNAVGRDLLKSWIVGYLNELQANGGIQNFVAEDIAVRAGESINAVAIDVAIQPVSAIEKIYITVRLTDE